MDRKRPEWNRLSRTVAESKGKEHVGQETQMFPLIPAFVDMVSPNHLVNRDTLRPTWLPPKPRGMAPSSMCPTRGTLSE